MYQTKISQHKEHLKFEITAQFNPDFWLTYLNQCIVYFSKLSVTLNDVLVLWIDREPFSIGKPRPHVVFICVRDRGKTFTNWWKQPWYNKTRRWCLYHMLSMYFEQVWLAWQQHCHINVSGLRIRWHWLDQSRFWGQSSVFGSLWEGIYMV